ncbi:MAG: coproporphyrinogen III oxidase, partial [Alphaproteobacteria bacterium]
DEETSEALYRLTEDILVARGMPAYEVSNYAKPGEESRHNLASWRGWEYVGVGPGAHGRISIATATGSGLALPAVSASSARIATATLKSPERWLSSVHEKGNGIEVWDALDERSIMEERLMMGLRLTDGVTLQEVEPLLDKDKLQFYIHKGLLTEQSNLLQVTLSGRLVLNRLITELIRQE